MANDTKPYAYRREVAPGPESAEDATADNVARYLACQVAADAQRLTSHYYLSSPPGDRGAAREFAVLAGRMQYCYGTLKLLRVLAQVAPGRADEVARDLWDDWSFGETASEVIGDWLAGHGIDVARIIAEVQPIDPAERTDRHG